MATTGYVYNSDGSVTFQTFANPDDGLIEIWYGDYPMTIHKARISLDTFDDVQTGFATVNCYELTEFPFSSYFATILDRRGLDKPLQIESDMPFTCPQGRGIFIWNNLSDGEGGYDNAYFTVNFSTSSQPFVTQDSGDILFGLAIIIFLLAIMFWGYVRRMIFPDYND